MLGHDVVGKMARFVGKMGQSVYETGVATGKYMQGDEMECSVLSLVL